MLLFSPVLYCNTYVCYYLYTVMCYIELHMYVIISSQSCVTLQYICMLLFIYSNVLDIYVSLQSCVALQYICMLLFVYSHVLHCITYVCYYLYTVMCYIALHMYVTLSLQSCVTVQYIRMLLFHYSHVLYCNTYVCYYLYTVMW